MTLDEELDEELDEAASRFAAWWMERKRVELLNEDPGDWVTVYVTDARTEMPL